MPKFTFLVVRETRLTVQAETALVAKAEALKFVMNRTSVGVIKAKTSTGKISLLRTPTLEETE